MKSKLVESTPKSLRLVESAEKRKGCLGRLEGICADFVNPTRNNRLYGLKLWQNVFNNELVKEGLKTKTLFGELDHPEERFECLSKLACIVMTDYNIDEDAGVVTGGFDILDTVQGRTLKALLDYGCQMGVSSRGTGDVIEKNGVEEVDPDTYEFSCFDVVSTPAVATARQTVVESVNQLNKRKTLLESINTEIKHCDSTLELNAIEHSVSNANVPNLDSILESIKDRKQVLVKESKTITSDSDVNTTLTNKDNDTCKLTDSKVKTNTKTISYDKFTKMCETVSTLSAKVRAYKLRERTTAKLINNYKQQIESLNNQLSDSKKVLNTQIRESKKVSQQNKSLKEKLNKSSNSLRESTKLHSDFDNKLSTMQKELLESKKQVRTLKNENVKNTENVTKLQERLQNSLSALSTEKVNSNKLKTDNSSLTEQLNESNQIINSYKDKQRQLKEKLSLQQSESSNTIKELTETINNLELENSKLINENNSLHNKISNVSNDLTESDITYNELTDKYNKLLEDYNKISSVNSTLTENNKSYMSNYLNELATKNGINPKSVKLTSNMTVDDIKQGVNEAIDRRDRYNKLPFSYEAPTEVNILKEHITNTNKDMEYTYTESFLQKVQDNL